MKCPSPVELADCLLGKLPDARTQTLLEHAGECATCGKQLDQLDDTADGVIHSLRVEQMPDFVSNAQCDRMILRAEHLVPSNPLESQQDDTKRHLLEGTRVRDYEILRPLGEGGMGAVFLARHVRLKREVAIKVLSLGRQSNSEAQKRFEQEMQIVGQLHHPGIVQALDAGEDHGVQYLVMEIVDGADLRHIVKLLGPLTLSDACEATYQAAAALEYAHSQNLIHRDVKPSNIMLSRDGTVKVMDLGIARFTDQQHSLTSTQQALGSLDFMAPEQLQAQGVDGLADVYALGCTLHFLLTGEPPQRRRTASLLVSKTPRLESLRHTLPPPVTNLMQQMLLTNPVERCDMANVAERLKPFCGSANLTQIAIKGSTLVGQAEHGESSSVTSEIATEPSSKRSRVLWAIAGVCAVCLLASWWLFPRSETNSVETKTGLDSFSSVSSNVKPVRELPLFQVHSGAIRCAAFCESTLQLIVGSDDSSISVRDLPMQKRICCLFANDVAIRKIVVAAEQKRFAVIDASSKISVFELPNCRLVWSSKKVERSPKQFGLASDEFLAVLWEDGETSLYQMANGKPPRANSKSNQIAESWVQKQQADEILAAAKELGVEHSEISLADSFVDSSWVVAKDRRVRLIYDASEKKSFVYAEHEDPITAVLAFEDQPLVLTGDEAGQIRLWQAPEQRTSDMLLDYAIRVDSMEMTYALHRNRWGADAFAVAPEQVRLDDHAGTMRLETTIERDGNNHTLQYKIIE